MKTSDFDYALPQELIAQKPLQQRSSSRLLQLEGRTGDVAHSSFCNVIDLCRAGDLLVMNDTRVLAARLFGQKATGGKVEVMVERVLSEGHFLAQLRVSKAPRVGSTIELLSADGSPSEFSLEIVGRPEPFFEIRSQHDLSELFTACGHMPLPPYIERADDAADLERYQTVFSKTPGAVAAPTAGLHFDAALLQALEKKGVNTASVTLHVGAGTFQPVRSEDPSEHVMHKEWLTVSQETCEAIRQTKLAGGRVIAVGTTSVRSLETAAQKGQIEPYSGDTQLFITPGYRFNVVDAMITNFHLPRSTLLMLVSAFAGYQATMHAYQQAVAERYRFFSYGDAMWVSKNSSVAVAESL